MGHRRARFGVATLLATLLLGPALAPGDWIAYAQPCGSPAPIEYLIGVSGMT